MLAFKIGIFFIVMLVLPYMAGQIFVRNQERGWTELAFVWCGGMLFMYGIFEIAAMLAMILELSLKKTAFLWGGGILMVIALGLFCRRQKGIGVRKPGLKKLQKIELFLAGIIILLILYQAAYVCIRMHIDDDDAYYIGMAVTSYYTNTISIFHPYTGDVSSIREMANWALSPYPIFGSMFGKVFSIHPAILMRSVMPAVSIVWSYVVYAMIGSAIFQERKSKLEFLLIVNVVNLFGAYSATSPSVFLLTRIWQGKAVITAIMIPLLWYCWIRIRRDFGERRLWGYLFLVNLAACLCSSMALFLCPILLGAFGLEYLVEKRDWRVIPRLAGAAIPCVLMMIGELCLLYL